MGTENRFENEEEWVKMDLTKYPEGPMEIVKYLDFIPGTDEEKMQFLLGVYVGDVLQM